MGHPNARGIITRQHTIWCGICLNWDQRDYHRKHDAERSWRKSGWRNTARFGWLCPRCYEKKEQVGADDSR